MASPGTCILCGCTDFRPCLGGVVFLSPFEAAHTHRLVPDEILRPGDTCCWVDEEETVCSAHTREEFAAVLEQRLADLGPVAFEVDRG